VCVRVVCVCGSIEVQQTAIKATAGNKSQQGIKDRSQ
jgi:hypothetical protein